MTSYIDNLQLNFSDGSFMSSAGTTSFSGNGYLKDPYNGYVYQWGQVNAGQPQTVYFPISFPIGVYGVYSSYTGGSGGVTDANYGWYQPYFFHNKNTSFAWFAIGH